MASSRLQSLGSAPTASASIPPSKRSSPIHTSLYRAATGVLRPLPLQTGWLPQGLFPKEQRARVRAAVTETLAFYGIGSPLPFDNLTGGGGDDTGEDSFEDLYEEDDDAEGDANEFIQFVTRSSPGHRLSAQETILITSDWNDRSLVNWPAALAQLQTLMTNWDGLVPRFEWEMIAAQRIRPVWLHPLDDHLVLQRLWNDSLLDGVMAILDNTDSTRDRVAAVTLSRLGPLYPAAANPPTVWVGLDHESPETEWPPIYETIKTFLKPVPRELTILFEHAVAEASTASAFDQITTQKPLPDGIDVNMTYDLRVNLGAKIGAAKYVPGPQGRQNPPFGTLGCYLSLKFGSESRTYALTSYHVLRPLFDGYEMTRDGSEADRREHPVYHPNRVPRPQTDLLRADREGVKPEPVTLEPLRVEHPPRWLHNKIMQSLERMIQDEEEKVRKGRGSATALQEYRENYQEKKAFFDNGRNILGPVYAASGWHHVTKGHRHDWALIEVRSERIGTNALPTDRETWTMPWFPVPEVCNTSALLRNPDETTSVLLMATGDHAWKFGAASRGSVGRCNGCKSFFVVRECAYLGQGSKKASETKEHLFVPCSSNPYKSLGQPGDSGSVVWEN